ncbi:hypothetical protein ATE84_2703 [Aquimarina sp. MAR_2010_214]|uniref:hypothetical protein n=1 Tax=Aquimarina sp. MAR_2010_214 TaxID=1250026 RepID=UPI000C705840|nr:hypothetical protein [Aquimarina sp. MAR_2010_214]PKV50640.1 hypothetical protein ATE84_2703 [Aquimarina sp. MAR_2010_214]
MRKVIYILIIVMLSSCSSVRVVDSWKNDEILVFKPKKLLILGVTQNLTARKIFEEELKNEFMKHNINAYVSTDIFDTSFTDSQKTEEEINTLVNELSGKGFDAVIISVVKGVDEKKNYSQGYYNVGYSWRRFGRYYYTYQDIYYNPGYYSEYKVYHVEASIYNINEGDDKSLVWVGALDIVDPQTISTTVKEYVNTIISRLEIDRVITRI